MKQFKLFAPNSCSQCGGPTGSHVFAKNADAARAGHGVCGACANVVTPAAAGDGQAVMNDDLTRLRGVGPKRVAELNTLGIFNYIQLTEADREILAVQLNTSTDNVANWQVQAAQFVDGE